MACAVQVIFAVSYVTPKRPKRMGCSCSTPVQHPAPVAAANVPKALPQVKAEKPEAEKPPVRKGYIAGAAREIIPGIISQQKHPRGQPWDP